MNRRDALTDLIKGGNQVYIPAAFFLHFDRAYHRGQAAVDKHLEYFKYTGMDFVKIQYEHTYPPVPGIEHPEDWDKLPRYSKDFFEEPLKVVEGLVSAAKKDAMVVVTLYSPFMCAGHAVQAEVRDRHMARNPQAIKNGMEAVTESVLTFVRECIRLGVDGFYASTQGGESGRFEDAAVFEECVKPYDLDVMEEINQKCDFNILHICDYHLPYRSLSPFLDYPGHVVNCNLQLDGSTVSAKEVARMFNRPYMGGLDRHGILVHGSNEQIRAEVESVLSQAPDRFILAADCTVPSDISWDNLRLAIETAHQYQR
jgi:uroporphyrinogen decarboxylase